jgi:hypothetical protein
MDILDLNRYAKKKRAIEGACGNEVNKISGKTETNRLVDKSGGKLNDTIKVD